MKQRIVLGTLLSVLVLCSSLLRAESPRPQASQNQSHGEQLAGVEQLKTEAFKALRGGDFNRTNELIAKAASLSSDPGLAQMSLWVKDFESQRQTFAAERHKQYEKAVGDVKKLLDHGKDTYAIDAAARAYSLADDKDAFRNEGWVKDLLARSVKLAGEFEASEQWLKTARLYSDLSQIEPANAEWKDRLKLV